MSTYQNIYVDYPARCLRVWKQIKLAATSSEEDLSVTAMLMTATSGFAMPWEHYKGGNSKEALRHPAFKGVKEAEYERALKLVTKQFSDPLGQSGLFCVEGQFAWKLGYADELSKVRDVGEYGDGIAVSERGKKTRFLLKVLRNALAHNNICAFGAAHNIEKLSFFSEDIDQKSKTRLGWDVATTTVVGF